MGILLRGVVHSSRRRRQHSRADKQLPSYVPRHGLLPTKRRATGNLRLIGDPATKGRRISISFASPPFRGAHLGDAPSPVAGRASPMPAARGQTVLATHRVVDCSAAMGATSRYAFRALQRALRLSVNRPEADGFADYHLRTQSKCWTPLAMASVRVCSSPLPATSGKGVHSASSGEPLYSSAQTRPF